MSFSWLERKRDLRKSREMHPLNSGHRDSLGVSRNRQPYAWEYTVAKATKLCPLFWAEKLQKHSLWLTHADLLISIKDRSMSFMFLTQTLGSGSNIHSNENGYPKKHPRSPSTRYHCTISPTRGWTR